MPKYGVPVQFCGKCGVKLNADNWYPAWQAINNATCMACANKGFPKRYCPICGESLQGRKCASCLAKMRCNDCGELLTQDNWYANHQRQGLKRCKTCHGKIMAAWQKANPESNRQRSARWRDRNPDHAKDYYQGHKEYYAERAINRLWKLKQEVINKMGGKCVVCGITDMRLLQINHLNGGGQQEQLFGIDMYQAIVTGNRGIEDLDVRCANHNLLYEYERGRRRAPEWYIPLTEKD